MQLARPFYRIGDVSRMIGVPPSTLRHWETEFPAFVKPLRGIAGPSNFAKSRVYSVAHVEALFEIHRLLHVEGYTTKGALAQLRRVRAERAAGA